MFEELLSGALLAAQPLLVALIGWLSVRVVAWLKTRTDNEFVQHALVKVGNAAFTVVKEVEQVMVSEVTKDGKLTKGDADLAKKTAVAKLKSYLSLPELLRLLNTKDAKVVDEYLASQVEAAVSEVKKSRPLAK